ncbi:hypothetical protein HKX48_005750 [Thoreauomyces humboldtii]|nr:hypothetical protein HKX48_005750 [Thoreauomyces humboldtii]
MLKSTLSALAFASLACAATVPQWIAPTADAVRSPCPMINSLANHGIISRDGKNIRPSDYLAAVKSQGLANDVGMVFAYGGALLFPHRFDADGNLVYGLDDARKHNAVEHDASLTRDDIYFNGDDYTFNRTLYDQMISYANPTTQAMDFWSFAQIRVARQRDSTERNPTADLSFLQNTKAHAEAGLILNILGWESGGTSIPISYMNAFFIEERLPYAEGWTPSPKPIGFAAIMKSQKAVQKLEASVQ